jgi:hypothetical protein
MSSGCNDTNGSRTRLYIFPEPDCKPNPKLHNLVVNVAAIAGATQISLQLDPTDTSYNSNTRVPLSAGLYLTIGTEKVEVVEPLNGSIIYMLSTTPQLVQVKRLKNAITINTTFTNFCFLKCCLTSNNIDTQTTSVDNTTNCSDVLETKLNVSYGKMIKMSGFQRSKDYAFYILQKFGKNLKTFWFALDYDGRFLVTGQFQGTDPSSSDASVKNIVKWTMDGHIQQIDNDYGSFVETATDLTALEVTRANYGLLPSVGVTVIPA